MVTRKTLIAVGPETAQPDDVDSTPAPADPVMNDEWAEEPSPQRDFGWLAPALAIMLVAGWTGFFAYVNASAILSGATPGIWAALVVDWCVPVLLVVALWLLAMRNSSREAGRFADAAQALSTESALLERRLEVVNRELSMARDFIAAQSRDLESLGRVASERLSVHADQLQGLIRTNGDQVETIARVSTTARENMDRLRDELPVISNSARDVASQIGHAGNVARDHIEELVAGFNRLNEFGEASGRQVFMLRGKVDEAIAGFQAQTTHMEEFAARRFADLAERSAAFRADLDGREVEAFAAVRRRADALAEELAERQRTLAEQEDAALEAMRARVEQLQSTSSTVLTGISDGEAEAARRWGDSIDGLQARLMEAIRRIAELDNQALENARRRLSALSEEAGKVDAAMAERMTVFETGITDRSTRLIGQEDAAMAALKARLAAIDAEVEERQQEHLAHVSGLAERGTAMAERLAELSLEMDRIAMQGREAGSAMDQGVSLLAARLGDAATAMDTGRQSILRLTDDSVRLLELIRSSADHGSKDLPRALADAETRLAAFRAEVDGLHDLVTATGQHSATLARDLQQVRNDGAATLDQVTAVEQRLAQVVQASADLAERTRTDLAAAIATLEDASITHLARLGEGQAEEVRNLAERIGRESSEAIGEALHGHAAAAIAELREAAETAGSEGRDVASLLREQLARVNELTGNLERRVAHARSKAQEQIDNDFSRRMALITESLNSAAIDVTRAFDTEITDTAWAGYLRGDRGIFTRRAVRLLDNQDVRGIGELYDGEGPFRETVNRYIHDFEAMLRSVLSTRDGNALAVTLLSSDIGKLYVVLAQSIERLRD